MQPNAEFLQADFGSTSRIEESLGVSQISAAPLPEVGQCFFCQLVESTSSHILIELTVPNARVEFGKPRPECGEFGRGEPQNSLLDLLYAAHHLQVTLHG